MRLHRLARLLLVVLVGLLSVALMLVGPAGSASAYAGVPVPVAWPSTLLGSLGITSGGVPAATGAGSLIAPGAAAAGGGTAAALAPVAVAAGGLALGFSIGTFIGQQACAGGVELLCMPRKSGYTPNTDVVSTGNYPGTTIYEANPSYYYRVDAYAGGSSECTANRYNAQGWWSNSATSKCWKMTDATIGDREAALHSGAAGTGTGAFLWSRQYWDGSEATTWVNADSTACASIGGCLSVKVRAQASSVTKVLIELGTPVPADPLRHWLTVGTCVKGATVQIVQLASATFYESATSYPKYRNVTCPTGFGLDKLTVRKITPSTSGDQIVWEWLAPEVAPGETIAVKYPECAGGECILRLWKVATSADPRLDCFDVPAACTDWYLDANKASKYECNYGSRVVPLADCNVYRPTFGTLVKIAAGTKTAADPDYANPDGSLPGGEPAVGTDPGAANDTCPPSFGLTSLLNPYWYYKTTVCAFQYLFVPAPGYLDGKVGGAVDALDASGAGQFWAATADSVGAVQALDDQAAGCAGPMLSDSLGGQSFTLEPLNACTAPMSTVAGVVRTILSLLIGFGGIWMVAQPLGAALGLRVYTPPTWDQGELF